MDAPPYDQQRPMNRYAIFYAPEPGDFAGAGAIWLGRDAISGRWVPQVTVPGLHGAFTNLTERPRRYGFHATLKAPFRLAPGHDEAALLQATEAAAVKLGPVTVEGLALGKLDRFLAFLPKGDRSALSHLAAALVRDLDGFRAPVTAADVARHASAGLTEAQHANLDRWGYPYVMEDYCFHLTLTGDLSDAEAAIILPAAERHFHGTAPRPLRINSICLFGEDEAGLFQLLRRVPLKGPAH